MKVIGLNEKEYVLNLLRHKENSKALNKSKLHLYARDVLKTCYPSYTIYEEVKLPGSTNPRNKSVLYLDFFIPNLMIGVEVHGEQHFQYVPYYHKNLRGFLDSQNRDELKAAWCEKNKIQLIILKHNEPHLWKKQIERA
jgi:hypothetical protein